MAADLLDKFRYSVEELIMIPSGSGRFEVIVGDKLIFSKKSLGRHAEEGEVLELFQRETGETPYTDA